MVLVTKELFIRTIETIRLQLQKDQENSQAIAKAFNLPDDVVFTYDNSPLIKMLVMLLQISFPKKDDHCEIEHFMFDMNFGKVGDQELITPEDLWYQLNKSKGLDTVISWKNTSDDAYQGSRHLTSTHPLIDDEFCQFNRNFTQKYDVRLPANSNKSLIDEVGHWDQSHFNQNSKK